MKDEEKKAINQLKADTSFYDYELKNGNYIYELFKIEVYKKNVDVILNLIEKQSKEIEELNKSDASKEQSSMNYYNLYKELVDKIKAKIEELEKQDKESKLSHNYLVIPVLQSLLEKE